MSGAPELWTLFAGLGPRTLPEVADALARAYPEQGFTIVGGFGSDGAGELEPVARIDILAAPDRETLPPSIVYRAAAFVVGYCRQREVLLAGPGATFTVASGAGERPPVLRKVER